MGGDLKSRGGAVAMVIAGTLTLGTLPGYAADLAPSPNTADHGGRFSV